MGPYTIVRRLYNGPYLVEDATGSQRRVPIDQLVFSRANKHPAVQAQNDAEGLIYEVKEILDSQMDTDTGNIEYLVWWKGFPKDEATWEPIQNINSTSLIRAYNRRVKLAAAREQLAASSSSVPAELDLRRPRKQRARATA